MQSSLLISDSKKFLDKYTRFITKDIYISLDMEKRFFDEYQYLVDEFSKNKYLYQEQDVYKKFFRIIHHRDELLKLHNKKYLKNANSKLDDFFDRVSSKEIVDSKEREMIISLEDKMVSIVREKYINFIGIKLLYLKKYLNKDMGKIQIICCDDEDKKPLKKELEICDLENVSLISLSDLEKNVLKDDEKNIDWDIIYQELFKYIVLEMYTDKSAFMELYQNFSYCIYLNSDYKDFDTFKDYHIYMYKRKFLDSGLNLKRFNEREIRIRRGQLRTVNNIFVLSKEMVDVGNFLYLNNVDYSYNKKGDYFVCSSKGVKYIITFHDGKIDKKNEVICLKRDKRYLEQLVYELVKRQFGMEKCDDDKIFSILRETSIDSYFSEFIRECLIPSIKFYSHHQSFENTRYNSKQKDILSNFYNKFIDIKKKYSFVDLEEIKKRVQDGIDKNTYDYYVVLGECEYRFKKYLYVLKNYPSLEIVKDYVRLSYQYRSYLNEHKLLYARDCFGSMEEITKLKNQFLVEYMDIFNQKIKNNDKNIYVYFYDDKEQFKVGDNLIKSIYSIVSSIRDREISFLFEDRREIKKMVGYGCFSKVGAYQVQSDIGKYDCYSLYTNKKCNFIILPFLIKDQYHMDMLYLSDVSRVKIGIYLALDKCIDGVCIMCPYSRKDEYIRILEGLSCKCFRV